MPAAVVPVALGVLLLGLITLRRNRFRRDLESLFGVEWRGQLPFSQLKGFIEAHRALNERLRGVETLLASWQDEHGDGSDDGDVGDVGDVGDSAEDDHTRRLDYLARSIDQRRRHILNDIKKLAAGRQGGETSLEKALRIHAGRMGMLDAMDDLVQGLGEVHGRGTADRRAR
jgi:hypothetical protein